jgi:SAM-dependent methyltransferase
VCPNERPIGDFGGWIDSAEAYIAFQDRGDANRTLLLDPVMLRLCGDVAGKRVLDAGCGEGRFARMLAERGAVVCGIDPIPRMLTAARERGPRRFLRAIAEHVPFADAAFDLVVSYVTLVDICGYREAIAEMTRVPRPGGALVVANLGFVTAGYGWERAEDGARLHQKIDRYAEEWSQVYEWAGIRIENFHRPLARYMEAYLGAGLTLRAFEEPVPADESLREFHVFEDWFRVPFFTVMRWEKEPARR